MGIWGKICKVLAAPFSFIAKDFIKDLQDQLASDYLEQTITEADFKNGLAEFKNIPLKMKKINEQYLSLLPIRLVKGLISQLEIHLPALDKLRTESIRVIIKGLKIEIEHQKFNQSAFDAKITEDLVKQLLQTQTFQQQFQRSIIQQKDHLLGYKDIILHNLKVEVLDLQIKFKISKKKEASKIQKKQFKLIFKFFEDQNLEVASQKENFLLVKIEKVFYQNVIQEDESNIVKRLIDVQGFSIHVVVGNNDSNETFNSWDPSAIMMQDSENKILVQIQEEDQSQKIDVKIPQFEIMIDPIQIKILSSFLQKIQKFQVKMNYLQECVKFKFEKDNQQPSQNSKIFNESFLQQSQMNMSMSGSMYDSTSQQLFQQKLNYKYSQDPQKQEQLKKFEETMNSESKQVAVEGNSIKSLEINVDLKDKLIIYVMTFETPYFKRKWNFEQKDINNMKFNQKIGCNYFCFQLQNINFKQTGFDQVQYLLKIQKLSLDYLQQARNIKNNVRKIEKTSQIQQQKSQQEQQQQQQQSEQIQQQNEQEQCSLSQVYQQQNEQGEAGSNMENSLFYSFVEESQQSFGFNNNKNKNYVEFFLENDNHFCSINLISFNNPQIINQQEKEENLQFKQNQFSGSKNDQIQKEFNMLAINGVINEFKKEIDSEEQNNVIQIQIVKESAKTNIKIEVLPINISFFPLDVLIPEIKKIIQYNTEEHKILISQNIIPLQKNSQNEQQKDFKLLEELKKKYGYQVQNSSQNKFQDFNQFKLIIVIKSIQILVCASQNKKIKNDWCMCQFLQQDDQRKQMLGAILQVDNLCLVNKNSQQKRKDFKLLTMQNANIGLLKFNDNSTYARNGGLFISEKLISIEQKYNDKNFENSDLAPYIQIEQMEIGKQDSNQNDQLEVTVFMPKILNTLSLQNIKLIQTQIERLLAFFKAEQESFLEHEAILKNYEAQQIQKQQRGDQQKEQIKKLLNNNNSDISVKNADQDSLILYDDIATRKNNQNDDPLQQSIIYDNNIYQDSRQYKQNIIIKFICLNVCCNISLEEEQVSNLQEEQNQENKNNLDQQEAVEEIINDLIQGKQQQFRLIKRQKYQMNKKGIQLNLKYLVLQLENNQKNELQKVYTANLAIFSLKLNDFYQPLVYLGKQISFNQSELIFKNRKFDKQTHFNTKYTLKKNLCQIISDCKFEKLIKLNQNFENHTKSQFLIFLQEKEKTSDILKSKDLSISLSVDIVVQSKYKSLFNSQINNNNQFQHQEEYQEYEQQGNHQEEQKFDIDNMEFSCLQQNPQSFRGLKDSKISINNQDDEEYLEEEKDVVEELEIQLGLKKNYSKTTTIQKTNSNQIQDESNLEIEKISITINNSQIKDIGIRFGDFKLDSINQIQKFLENDLNKSKQKPQQIQQKFKYQIKENDQKQEINKIEISVKQLLILNIVIDIYPVASDKIRNYYKNQSVDACKYSNNMMCFIQKRAAIHLDKLYLEFKQTFEQKIEFDLQIVSFKFNLLSFDDYSLIKNPILLKRELFDYGFMTILQIQEPNERFLNGNGAKSKVQLKIDQKLEKNVIDINIDDLSIKLCKNSIQSFIEFAYIMKLIMQINFKENEQNKLKVEKKKKKKINFEQEEEFSNIDNDNNYKKLITDIHQIQNPKIKVDKIKMRFDEELNKEKFQQIVFHINSLNIEMLENRIHRIEQIDIENLSEQYQIDQQQQQQYQEEEISSIDYQITNFKLKKEDYHDQHFKVQKGKNEHAFQKNIIKQMPLRSLQVLSQQKMQIKLENLQIFLKQENNNSNDEKNEGGSPFIFSLLLNNIDIYYFNTKNTKQQNSQVLKSSIRQDKNNGFMLDICKNNKNLMKVMMFSFDYLIDINFTELEDFYNQIFQNMDYDFKKDNIFDEQFEKIDENTDFSKQNNKNQSNQIQKLNEEEYEEEKEKEEQQYIEFIFVDTFELQINFKYGYILSEQHLIKNAPFVFAEIEKEHIQSLENYQKEIIDAYYKTISPQVWNQLTKVIGIRNINNIVKGFGNLFFIPYDQIRKGESAFQGIQKGVKECSNTLIQEAQGGLNIIQNLAKSTFGYFFSSKKK